MVPLEALLALGEIGLQGLAVEERGAIDPLQSAALLIAAPVGRGGVGEVKTPRYLVSSTYGPRHRSVHWRSPAYEVVVVGQRVVAIGVARETPRDRVGRDEFPASTAPRWPRPRRRRRWSGPGGGRADPRRRGRHLLLQGDQVVRGEVVVGEEVVMKPSAVGGPMPRRALGKRFWTAWAMMWVVEWRMIARPAGELRWINSTSASASGTQVESRSTPSSVLTAMTPVGPLSRTSAPVSVSTTAVPAGRDIRRTASDMTDGLSGFERGSAFIIRARMPRPRPNSGAGRQVVKGNQPTARPEPAPDPDGRVDKSDGSPPTQVVVLRSTSRRGGTHVPHFLVCRGRRRRRRFRRHGRTGSGGPGTPARMTLRRHDRRPQPQVLREPRRRRPGRIHRTARCSFWPGSSTGPAGTAAARH